MPGLINGHFHSQANLLAGALHNRPLELFMLFEVPPYGMAEPDPRLVYLQTMLGAIEMLKCGVTAVHDDAFHNPYPTQESISALMRAYADSGLRATVSINHQNLVEYAKFPFLDELLPADIRAEMDRAPRATTQEMADLYRWFHATWHGAENGRLRIAVSNSAPQRVSEDYFAFLSAFSREHDLPFNIHLLETKTQRVLGADTLGKSLIRHVHDLGFLDERVMVIHAIWVDDDDIALMADAGCVVAHNPMCNLKLGSGIMPFRKLRDAGIPIALGSDEKAADDSTDMWAVAKMASLIHRVTDPDYLRWPEPREILQCATRGGARGMRRPDIGSLEAGKQADLILLDLDHLGFTPLNDLRRQLVYCVNGGAVAHDHGGGPRRGGARQGLDRRRSRDQGGDPRAHARAASRARRDRGGGGAARAVLSRDVPPRSGDRCGLHTMAQTLTRRAAPRLCPTYLLQGRVQARNQESRRGRLARQHLQDGSPE